MKPFTVLNKFLTISVAAAALVFTSCKKDNTDNNGGGKEDSRQLIRFEESATNYTIFDYNSAGQITKMTGVEDGEQENFTITYGSNKKPSVASSGDHSIQFTYTGDGLLDKANLFNGSTESNMIGYIKLNYQGNQVKEAVTYIMDNDPVSLQPVNKVSYEYYANGDVKSNTISFWNPLEDKYTQSETVVYEYDTRNNPFTALGELYQVSFDMPSKHNAVKETKYDNQNNIVSTTTYTYTYDSAGYPTQAEKKVTTPNQANPVVSHYKYTYK